MMFVAAAAMMFASCDKDDENNTNSGGNNGSNAEVASTSWVGYQGNPQTDDNYATYTLTFNSDNTCAMSIAFYAVSEGGNYATTHFAGTYTVSGNSGTLTMSDDILGEEYNDTFTIDGDVLTLTHGRVTVTMTRSNGGDDPDDDIDYVGNLWEKVGLISSILLMVAVAIIVVMIVNKTTGIFNRNNTGNLINPTKHVTSTPTPTEVPKTGVMPNLIGQTYVSAYATLMELGLDLRIDQKAAEVASKDIPEDSVCEQSPLEGSPLKVGSMVVLTLSIGKGNMKVPDVKGMPIDKARVLLEQLNVTEEDENDDSEIGTVLRTNPAAGTEVKKGSDITVYYSKGPEMVTVPRVIGMTLANAEKTIKAAELKYEIIEEYSDVEAGVVYEQTPGDNTSVKKGFKVSIFVSKGPEPTPSPTPTPSPEPTPSPTPTPIPTPTEDVAPPDNQGAGDGE